MNNVTLRDIAKALNLSVSTVSRALTDSYQIGDKTKQRVLAYAKEHHYVPNRMAKSLKEGKSRSIGVVVCAIDNSFVAQMLDGIDQYCTANNYQLIIMQSKESYEQEKACINLLYAGGIDGLLISPSYQTVDFSDLNQLQAAGLPIVLFDRLSKQMETHKVASDNFKGAYDATMHLIANGYRTIAHLNSNSKLSLTTERLEGYQKALADAGLSYREELVKFCDTSNPQLLDAQVNAAIIQLLDLIPKPDAIFTATDQLSTKSLMVLNQLNYQVPKDMAIMGFSNSDLAEILNPALSTVQQPAFNIGNLAAKKLIELIENRGTADFETVLLPTTLHIRASSQAKS